MKDLAESSLGEHFLKCWVKGFFKSAAAQGTSFCPLCGSLMRIIEIEEHWYTHKLYVIALRAAMSLLQKKDAIWTRSMTGEPQMSFFRIFMVNTDDTTLLCGALLPHPPSMTSLEQLAVFSQALAIRHCWKHSRQRGAVLQGDTVPCFMEQSCIV